jgi:3-oxoacyl-[acyl-carrier protein] reductase
MDLRIKDKLFVVGGASSGLGKAIALQLLEEGATVIGIGRNRERFGDMTATFPATLEVLELDLSEEHAPERIVSAIGSRTLSGVLVNGGGPPAKKAMETTLADWDAAYAGLLRWKVALTQALVPLMTPHGYGRMLFLESASIRQPIENLVLSTALRMAVAGFVKTLSQEMSTSGITFNLIAPGSHDTPAIERLYHKKSEQTGKSYEAIREEAIAQAPTGALGQPGDFAQLACWLLSPGSRFVTGQTYLVDGGSVKGT